MLHEPLQEAQSCNATKVCLAKTNFCTAEEDLWEWECAGCSKISTHHGAPGVVFAAVESLWDLGTAQMVLAGGTDGPLFLRPARMVLVMTALVAVERVHSHCLQKR